MGASALTSTKLFCRALTLTVACPTNVDVFMQAQFNDTSSTGLDISGLDVEFVVEKSLKAGEFNTCAIKVYNLAPESRQMLSGAAAPLTVKLEAGYAGGTSQLYFAGARAAWTTREGPNFITHIESTDTIARPTGVKATHKINPNAVGGSVYRTTGARIPLKQAFQSIATQLGIDEGNLQQAMGNLYGAPITAVNAAALVGNGAKRMTDLCRSAGLEWSIQDGGLQLLNIGKALSTTSAIQLDSTTGLIESPSVDSQGVLTIKSLLIPGIAPGVLLNVNSLFVQGGYRVEKVRYAGNTVGQEWYAEMTAVKY